MLPRVRTRSREKDSRGEGDSYNSGRKALSTGLGGDGSFSPPRPLPRVFSTLTPHAGASQLRPCHGPARLRSGVICWGRGAGHARAGFASRGRSTSAELPASGTGGPERPQTQLSTCLSGLPPPSGLDQAFRPGWSPVLQVASIPQEQGAEGYCTPYCTSEAALLRHPQRSTDAAGRKEPSAPPTPDPEPPAEAAAPRARQQLLLSTPLALLP